MSSESEQTPYVIVSYEAKVRANGALLRSLLGMLVRKKLLSLSELDALYTEAIDRCHANAEPSGPEEQLSSAEEAAAYLALVRGTLRQSLGGKS